MSFPFASPAYSTGRCMTAFALAMICLITAPVTACRADVYPSRAITLVVPFSAGGSTDLLGRVIAEKLGKALGQPVIVENRTGGPGASIGTSYVARATGDGYTLLLGSTTTHTVGPNVYKLPYDTLRDFSPIALAVRLPQCIVVTPGLPATTIPEMLEYARRHNEGFTAATTGSGTLSHLQNLLLQSMTRVSFVSAHYRGSAPAIVDLMAGNVQTMFDNVSSVLEYHQSGRLRILAVTTAQRIPALPDVPTIAESVPGYEATGWIGVFAPRGTSEALVHTLSEQLNRILMVPEVRADLRDRFGMEAANETPKQFEAMIRADHEKWRELVERAKLKVD